MIGDQLRSEFSWAIHSLIRDGNLSSAHNSLSKSSIDSQEALLSLVSVVENQRHNTAFEEQE
jgi:hypothetical protein